jgi:hypothetical protein
MEKIDLRKKNSRRAPFDGKPFMGLMKNGAIVSAFMFERAELKMWEIQASGKVYVLREITHWAPIPQEWRITWTARDYDLLDEDIPF